MFSVHDRVSWIETTHYTIPEGKSKGGVSLKTKTLTGTIVAEEDDDRYKVKRDDTGKCEILCQRKLRKVDVA
jgi:hypothetical protein